MHMPRRAFRVFGPPDFQLWGINIGKIVSSETLDCFLQVVYIFVTRSINFETAGWEVPRVLAENDHPELMGVAYHD